MCTHAHTRTNTQTHARTCVHTLTRFLGLACLLACLLAGWLFVDVVQQMLLALREFPDVEAMREGEEHDTPHRSATHHMSSDSSDSDSDSEGAVDTTTVAFAYKPFAPSRDPVDTTWCRGHAYYDALQAEKAAGVRALARAEEDAQQRLHRASQQWAKEKNALQAQLLAAQNKHETLVAQLKTTEQSQEESLQGAQQRCVVLASDIEAEKQAKKDVIVDDVNSLLANLESTLDADSLTIATSEVTALTFLAQEMVWVCLFFKGMQACVCACAWVNRL